MNKRFLFHSEGMTVALMIGATMISKVLGMLRQMMTARIFGASMEGIAFSAASGIPLAIFDMLFSTAIMGVFLPIYKGWLGSDEKRAGSFSSSFLTVVFLLTSLAAVMGVIFAGPIIRIAAPDLDENTASLAVILLRVMFPSVIFAGAAYILIGILQSHEKFLLPALVSAVSNLLMLLYLSVCRAPFGKGEVIGLAVSYLLSWAIQFFTLAVPLWKMRNFPGLTRRWKTPDTVLAGKRSLPVIFGSWLVPVTTLIAKAFSSFAHIGSGESNLHAGAAIVAYENAFSVFSIASGFLTYGICNYLFPKLSKQFSDDNAEEFGRSVRKGFFAAIALILPISGAMFLLSQEIVVFLYLRGSYTSELAEAASVSLRILVFAMPACGMTEFFSRVYYSCAKVRYPMRTSLAGIAVAWLSCAIFFRMGITTVETVALSVVLGQTAAGLLLLLSGRHFFKGKGVQERGRYFGLVSGTVLCVVAMWFCRNFLRKTLHFSDAFQNLVIMTIVFAVGFVVYLIWLILVRVIRISDLRFVGGDENL